MNRLLGVLLLIAACGKAPAPVAPPPCQPIPAPARPGVPADVVWGFADLHTHPAIERAFHGSLVWGKAIDDAPVNATELPRIAACPVETHTQPGTGPIDRAVGAQVFPAVANIASFAHGPVATGGLRPTTSWPNARDVIHQQMNISSIRRAYEGGLRLMFAATTDDQVIAALLSGPNFVDGFVPKPHADFESASTQIALIREIAKKNANWMGIARTPADARKLISEGRLALVISLEMNGFQPGEVETLRRTDDARHVFPVHLIDNGIGGTAANASLFNSASSAVSALYRSDHKANQYMDVVATTQFTNPLGWPQALVQASPPVYVGLQNIPYLAYTGLCYEPLTGCAGADAVRTTFTEVGQQNLRGLCTTAEECLANERPGAALILEMMDAGMMIDVSHMGARSVAETLQLDPAFPLMASHGDIANLCRGFPTQPPCVDANLGAPTERSLDSEAAREIVRRNGVLGLGTGLGVYDSRNIFSARASPLLTLDPAQAQTSDCVTEGGSDGCVPALKLDLADAGTPLDTLQVDTLGGISGIVANAQPFVRVELRDPVPADAYQRRVVLTPMVCTSQACRATVTLGAKQKPLTPPPAVCEAASCETSNTCEAAPYTVDDLEQVTVQWLYLKCDGNCANAYGADVREQQCSSQWQDARAASWTMTRIDLTGKSLGQPEVPIARLAARGEVPLVTLVGMAGSFTAYNRNDRPSVNAKIPASGHLLRVSMTSSNFQSALPGSSAQQVGANSCVALRTRVGASCPANALPAAKATECPDGWAAINQRGEWKQSTMLYTFLRYAGDPTQVCGIDFAVLDWKKDSGAFAIDAVKVDVVEDPVGHWIRRYASIMKHVADGRLGMVTFGTDFNGLNGTTDISELPVPAGALAASACPVTEGKLPANTQPLALSPMRFRSADGTLGEEVLLEERGLATYGLLADFVQVAAAYPGCGEDVRDSLMLSAETTLRAWETIVDPATAAARAPLPRGNFACGAAPGVAP